MNTTTTTTTTLTLDDIAAAAPVRMYVENIGGGVMALVTYDGLTLTLAGGRRAVDTEDEGPAHVLVCQDGASTANGWASTATEAAALVPLPAPLVCVPGAELTVGDLVCDQDGAYQYTATDVDWDADARPFVTVSTDQDGQAATRYVHPMAEMWVRRTPCQVCGAPRNDEGCTVELGHDYDES